LISRTKAGTFRSITLLPTPRTISTWKRFLASSLTSGVIQALKTKENTLFRNFKSYYLKDNTIKEPIGAVVASQVGEKQYTILDHPFNMLNVPLHDFKDLMTCILEAKISCIHEQYEMCHINKTGGELASHAFQLKKSFSFWIACKLMSNSCRTHTIL